MKEELPKSVPAQNTPESADETADRENHQSKNSDATKIRQEVKEENTNNIMPKYGKLFLICH